MAIPELLEEFEEHEPHFCEKYGFELGDPVRIKAMVSLDGRSVFVVIRATTFEGEDWYFGQYVRDDGWCAFQEADITELQMGSLEPQEELDA
ncbi:MULTISPECIES: hypothetical protein [Haloarcula]|uniref:hypothetical protein n=1 Tax=Haloarcula TaxID=2237 RepID=UPI0023E89CF9|nr:hypothetical protein [Halomicroarcula sp. SHR3]